MLNPDTARRAAFSPRQRIVDLRTHPHAYVTVQEFATYLRVSVRLVRKWIGAGALPVYIFQGRWRIAKGDALAFVERARLRV